MFVTLNEVKGIALKKQNLTFLTLYLKRSKRSTIPPRPDCMHFSRH